MKKLKLLSSLSALVLVLSLGACNQPEEETSEELTSSESTTSPEEPEPVVLSNYTLSITLIDVEGNPVVIPFYDTVYIIGDWDNWTEFTALTDAGDEQGSVLTTTLETISEGTHEFKGVVGNQDDTPSWNLTELITNGSGNATFEVAASEGDNATKNLEFTVDATKIPVLEETPMSDEEIASAIIAACEEVYDNVGWEAIHGYSAEDDEISTEVWYTADEEGGTYGKAIWNGEEVRYIIGGTQYAIDSDGEYDTYPYSQEYEDEFSNYATALSEIEYASLSNCAITHEEGTTTYTLTVTNNGTDIAVAQRAGDTFTIVSVLDSYEGEDYFAEVIDASAVEVLMDSFNHLYWDNATTPVEFIDKACLTGNYSIQIVLDQFESDYISYSDYDTGNYDLDSLYETMSFAEEYVIDAYYTEDALLIDYYYIICGSKVLFEEDLYVNTLLYESLPCCDYYFTDGETWYYYDSYVGYEWRDLFWSLFDNPYYFGFDETDFSLVSSEDGVDAYNFTSYDAMYYFALLTGADIWSPTYANPYYLTYFDYVYFSAKQEMMQTSYLGNGWVYGDYTYTTVAYYQRQFVTTFYDVGQTEISEDLIAYVEENAVEYEED